MKKRRWLRFLAYAAGTLLALVIALAVTIRLRYGGGTPFPDRSGRAERPFSDLEVVANLERPPESHMRTLFRDRRIRWPDGFSFGLEGHVYFTCSSLQYVILESESTVLAHGPYQIYRFASGATAPAGQ